MNLSPKLENSIGAVQARGKRSREHRQQSGNNQQFEQREGESAPPLIWMPSPLVPDV
jgi:hypothetical protein